MTVHAMDRRGRGDSGDHPDYAVARESEDVAAAAHTLPREELAFGQFSFDPRWAARVTVPTLLLVGSVSPAWGPEAMTVADALPDARIEVLEGQSHAADVLAPELVAAPLLAFLNEGL